MIETELSMTVKLTDALSACDEEVLTTIVVRQASGLRAPTQEPAADKNAQWNR